MKKFKKKLELIIISAILFIIAIVIPFNNELINKTIFIISYLIVGFPILKKAFKNIKKGDIFDENFLMTIATLGAFAIGEFPEAVAVMLFFQVGEFFQDYATDKSRKSIKELMNIRPDYANVKKNNEIIKVDPEDVEIGEIIVIKPGEKIPIDGIIVNGESYIDTSNLTGESKPKKVSIGDSILSGVINKDGLLEVKTNKEFKESTVSKILDLVENAGNRKAKAENFITVFAKYYTPIVVVIALLLAFVPPLFFRDTNLLDWIYRALTFLVVSCPCALVISIPLSFFGGIGRASKVGILVKGSNYLEALSDVKTIVYDKTGTLTKGVFEVQEICPNKLNEDEFLKVVAHCEYYSNHPISESISKINKQDINKQDISNFKEISGYGIEVNYMNKKIYIGNKKLMEEKEIKNFKPVDKVGTVLYVAIDGSYEGYILISDTIKQDSKIAIDNLRKNNVNEHIMLTGDKKEVGEDVAKKLGLNKCYSELLPTDKVRILESIINKKNGNEKVVFVGDGINDSPVLALSDIGISMGKIGADSSIEAADIVIMTDEISKIVDAIKISKKTMRIVKENIIFAIFVKVSVLILSAFGLSTMWMAVFADVGVSIIAILNSLRMLNTKT